MRLIWATRGKEWGFSFLARGGFPDPLGPYEDAFVGLDGVEFCRTSSGAVALRFRDPEGRRDRARRPISHDFVLYGQQGAQIRSVEDGRKIIWPLVSDHYGRIWDQPRSQPLVQEFSE